MKNLNKKPITKVAQVRKFCNVDFGKPVWYFYYSAVNKSEGRQMSICTDEKRKVYEDGKVVREERVAVDIISGRRVRDPFLEETFLAFIEMLRQERTWWDVVRYKLRTFRQKVANFAWRRADV